MSQFSQKTLVIVKPDGMRRHLIGEIVKRLEQVGLDLVDVKYTQAGQELAAAHYPVTNEWLDGVGGKSLGDYEKYGLDPMATLGTADPREIGQMIHQFNIKYLMSSPVLAMVWQGNHAIEIVRKLVGSTVASMAAPGTIRGDYATDSAIAANADKRSIENLVHASGSEEEATREIELWFGNN